MLNVVLLMTSEEVKSMIAFTLESETEAVIHSATSAGQVMHRLSRDPGSVDMVVFQYEEEFAPLLKSLKSKNSDIMCIACEGANTPAVPENIRPKKFFQLSADQLPAGLVQVVNKLAERTLETDRERLQKAEFTDVEKEYVRINSALLIRVSPLKAPIYIRLSQEKFLKIFQEGDNYSQEDQRRYGEEKKIDYFYLKTDDTDEFIEKFSADLSRLMGSKLSPEKLENVSKDTHETVQELVTKMGPTPAVQALMKTSIESSLKTLGRQPRLRNILANLVRDRERYIASHSQQVAAIACAIASTMQWSSEATFQKLSYAAFMHDITLTNQALAAIATLDELEESGARFSEHEKKEFKLHPTKAAEIVRRFQEIPPDVDTIVSEHHERPDGTGFPRKLRSNRISPLSAVFIVSHEIVRQILASEHEFKMLDFIMAHEDRFNSGNFRKILNGLRKLEF